MPQLQQYLIQGIRIFHLPYQFYGEYNKYANYSTKTYPHLWRIYCTVHNAHAVILSYCYKTYRIVAHSAILLYMLWGVLMNS